MDINKIEKAQKMCQVISDAPISSEVKDKFYQMAERGDVDGIWDYFNNCIALRADVGKRVEESNEISFEMLFPEVKKIKEAP